MNASQQQSSVQRYKLYKDKKFLVAAAITVTFFISGGYLQKASADSLPGGGPVTFAGKDGTVSFSGGSSEPVMNIRMNGTAVFCINPFVIVHSGALATQAGQNDATSSLFYQMSSYQRDLVNNVAWIGQSQGAANNGETYMATQLAIWSLLAGQNGVSGVMGGSSRVDTSQLHNVLGGQTVTGWASDTFDGGVVSQAQQILDNAAALSQTPTFNPAPLNIIAGHSGTITDTNNVDLSKYKRLTGSNGVTAYTNGTSVVINVADSAPAGAATLNLDTGLSNNPVHYIYGTSNPDGTTGQTLYGSGDPSRILANVNINVLKANLKITKDILQDNGTVNQHLSNSNYSLAGNVFEVHKDTADGPVVKTLTTDANGYVETGEVMDYGHYVITEKQAGNGLYNSFTPIAVDLDDSGQRIEAVSGTNKEVRGEATITKNDSKTGADTEGKATFKGAQYALLYQDGTPVKWHADGQPDPIIVKGTSVDDANVVLQLDDNAQAAVKNLPLGDYYWQEVKEPEGYEIDKSKLVFSLTYNGQYNAQVDASDTSKENVVTFTFDGFKYVRSASGTSETGYNGINLKLVPLDGTKGSVITTTTQQDANGYDGYYKFSGVPYGDYELEEDNAPDGFQFINPMIIHIALSADQKSYVLTMTEKGQAVPMKTVTVTRDTINEGKNDIYLSKTALFDISNVKMPTPTASPQTVTYITNVPNTTPTPAPTSIPTVQPTVQPVNITSSALPYTGIQAHEKPNYLVIMSALLAALVGVGSYGKFQTLKRKRQRLALINSQEKYGHLLKNK